MAAVVAVVVVSHGCHGDDEDHELGVVTAPRAGAAEGGDASGTPAGHR